LVQDFFHNLKDKAKSKPG